MPAFTPTSMPVTAPKQRERPRARDYLALALLKLAKFRRRAFTARTGDAYGEFYEGFFDEKDLELYERDRRLVVRRETVLRSLAEEFTDLPASVIDVGCGLGEVMAALPPSYSLAGMDYAASNVAATRRRLGDRADVRQGSIYDIPFDSNRFDVALCLEVLEHIEDDARGVREIARVLRPGGILIAAVPYTYYWPQYLELMGHFRHYTRQSFANLMDENGLRTERFLPNYPNWHQAYTRRYTAVRAQSMTVGRLLGQRAIYSFKWPWQRRPAIESLAERLEPLRRRDATLDYAAVPTSTFLLARKPVSQP
jgi:SAM-dependent methyltransferase